MIIIGLAGGSGSGKSTLVENIMPQFPQGIIGHIPMDAYYKDHSHLSAEEKKLHNFDHPDSIDFELLLNHLAYLKLGMEVERPAYSFITCSRLNITFQVKPCTLLIIDGILTLSNIDLCNALDTKVFLGVSEENRLKRTLLRDINERGRTKESVEERFYRTVKPMHDQFVEPTKHNANYHIDGNTDNIALVTENFRKIIEDCLKPITQNHQ